MAPAVQGKKGCLGSFLNYEYASSESDEAYSGVDN
jgi:hypothetical protein